MELILLGLLGMVISMVLGMLWYSLKTPMGKLQMQATGHGNLSHEEQKKRMDAMKPQMWKYMLAQAILALLTSLFIAFIMLEQLGLGIAAILWRSRSYMVMLYRATSGAGTTLGEVLI